MAWTQMMAHLLQIFGGDVDRDLAEKILRQTIPEPLRLTDPVTISEVLDLHAEMKGVSRGLAMIRYLPSSSFHTLSLDSSNWLREVPIMAVVSIM